MYTDIIKLLVRTQGDFGVSPCVCVRVWTEKEELPFSNPTLPLLPLLESDYALLVPVSEYPQS